MEVRYMTSKEKAVSIVSAMMDYSGSVEIEFNKCGGIVKETDKDICLPFSFENHKECEIVLEWFNSKFPF